MDDRGYVPTEWWIMSKTPAENTVTKDKEGLTSIKLGADKDGNLKSVLLTEALDLAEEALMGKYRNQWPLTKVLDIGGANAKPSFGGEEVPPIPPHVHAGYICDGCCGGQGKLEAYFFPPLDVPPYNMDLGEVTTRLGLKPATTKTQCLKCLKQFGIDDSMYTLLNKFKIKPRTTWHIPTHVVHSPGPWPTFEIQLPQDDSNLLAWRLGDRLSDDEREGVVVEEQLKGISSHESLLEQTLKWDLNIDKEFEKKWHHTCENLDEGDWGRRMRLFYHDFYGEGFEINSKKSYTRQADDRPYAGIVWSGSGTINGQKLDVADASCREFLITPNTAVTFESSSDTPLLCYTVFPFELQTEDDSTTQGESQ